MDSPQGCLGRCSLSEETCCLELEKDETFKDLIQF